MTRKEQVEEAVREGDKLVLLHKDLAFLPVKLANTHLTFSGVTLVEPMQLLERGEWMSVLQVERELMEEGFGGR